MILGVDVGGTFTDLVLWDGSRLRTGKLPSSPMKSTAVIEGMQRLAPGGVARLLHGTTVATNALLERRGARTALVSTPRFGDVIEIGRQDRPSLYDSMADRPVPLVPAGLRFDADEELVEALVAAAPEAVAVSLLYAFRDPEAERRVVGAVAAALPGVPISPSSEVVAEFREFERASTTVLNAYLTPVTGAYLEDLVAQAATAGVSGDVTVMRSSGGLMTAQDAARLPAAILLSGPAGGVVAAGELGRALGHDHVISFDMGGTSTDVCRIDHGRPEVAYERPIEGYPCRMPAVAVHTVGAGGGSIAWVDEGGALRVGPQSAGATPGPASYGRGGTDAAVTDANLLLARIDPAALLAGSLAVQDDLAAAALIRIGDRLRLPAEEVAFGMVEVVEAHMARAVRTVSVEQGADPRSSVLMAFGGAGGLHATALARSLDMAGVVVPPHAGVFSALGLLLSPARSDTARTVMIVEGAARLDAEVEAQAGAVSGDRVRTIVDVRYRGQSHETSVPYAAGDGWEELAGRFHAAHRERNGFARPGDPIEAVTIRAEAVAAPALRWDEIPPAAPEGDAARAGRPVRTREGIVAASVWWRPGLAPGDEVIGPAVIEEDEATTFLHAGERATVHESGALVVEW